MDGLFKNLNLASKIIVYENMPILINEGFVLETSKHIINIILDSSSKKFNITLLSPVFGSTECHCCHRSNIAIGSTIFSNTRKRRYAKQKYLYQNKR